MKTYVNFNLLSPKRAQITLLVAGLMLALIPACVGAGEVARAGAGVYGKAAITETVQAVFTNYFKIASALADDSMKGVADCANALAKAIKDDKTKLLSPELAASAEELAKAKDLAAARATFKSISEALINYLADRDVRSTSYREINCPMAEAVWLQQKDEETRNPYMGASMLQCGTPKRIF